MFGRARNFPPVSPTNKPSFDLTLPGAVHVWTARLDDLSEEEFAALRACLDADETTRAQRFYFERDRRHFTAARGSLRRLLGRYLGIPAEQVCFGYGPRGKPFVAANQTALRFNLSHSHGRAMFVFAHGRDVGIDLEAGARLGDDWPGLVRRVFSAREQALLAALPPEARRAGFLNGWTRKEAYLKATGLGIVDGLQTIEVTLSPDDPPALLAAPAGMAWTLRDLPMDGGFAAALVVEGAGAINLTRLEYAEHF